MLKTEYKVYIIIFAVIAIVIIFKHFFKNGNYALITDAYEDPYIIDNIITEQEANHIINKSSMYFNDSRILGDTLDTKIRKSKSTWLYKDDPIIMKIMLKISGIVKLPIEPFNLGNSKKSCSKDLF